MSAFKRFFIFYSLICACNCFAATHIRIDGQQAKTLYNALTGSQVKQEGAAGHLYKQGKNVLCVYTNADMDDKQGNPVSRSDIRRYVCKIKFNANGLATPDGNA